MQLADYLTLPFLCALHRVANNEALITYSWHYNYTVHVPYSTGEISAGDSAEEMFDGLTYRVEPKKFRCKIVSLFYCFLINLYLES